MRLRPDRRFGRSSNVHRYWLIRCEGFAVLSDRGRRLGVVVRVFQDESGRHASAVEIRGRGLLRRRRTVSAHAVEEVAPWEEAIVVRGRPRRERRPVPWRPVARVGFRAGRAGVRVGWRAAAETVRACDPHARRAVHAAVVLASQGVRLTGRVARVGFAYGARIGLNALRAARKHGPPAARGATRAAAVAAVRVSRVALDGLSAVRDWQRRYALRRRAADWLEALYRGH